MYKLCIVLQGKLYKEIINDLITTFEGINDIILSTWHTEDIDCINICRQKGFDVILQDLPGYITQANYQVKSLSAGFKRAIDLGYTHAFRFRTDMKINDIKKLLHLLENNAPRDKLSFLTMYQNEKHTAEYLLDFITYGPLDKLLNYWNTYQYHDDNRFIELFLMETYFKRSNIKYSDIEEYIYYFQKLCYENNITIEWTKPEYKNQGNLIYKYYIYNNHIQSIKDKLELNII